MSKYLGDIEKRGIHPNLYFTGEFDGKSWHCFQVFIGLSKFNLVAPGEASIFNLKESIGLIILI